MCGGGHVRCWNEVNSRMTYGTSLSGTTQRWSYLSFTETESSTCLSAGNTLPFNGNRDISFGNSWGKKYEVTLSSTVMQIGTYAFTQLNPDDFTTEVTGSPQYDLTGADESISGFSYGELEWIPQRKRYELHITSSAVGSADVWLYGYVVRNTSTTSTGDTRIIVSISNGTVETPITFTTGVGGLIPRMGFPSLGTANGQCSPLIDDAPTEWWHFPTEVDVVIPDLDGPIPVPGTVPHPNRQVWSGGTYSVTAADMSSGSFVVSPYVQWRNVQDVSLSDGQPGNYFHRLDATNSFGDTSILRGVWNDNGTEKSANYGDASYYPRPSLHGLWLYPSPSNRIVYWDDSGVGWTTTPTAWGY